MKDIDIRNADKQEPELDNKLRPLTFDDFNGQNTVVDNLRIYVEAARRRGEPLDHVLLYGPPGLGKTTLSTIIANQLGVNMVTTSGPVIEKPSDLTSLLVGLKKNDVLFIDEIHRIKPVVEEYLYSAMEDYKIDIIVGSGPEARAYSIPLEPFTLVGATTRSGLLTGPFRDRFSIKLHMEYYDVDVLSRIVRRSAAILKVGIDDESCRAVALRSRGTPRIANALLRRVRDFAEVVGNGNIDSQITEKSLNALNIDEYGLDETDCKILLTVIDKFDGGPVGVSTIATAVGEDAGTIEDVYEPYLIQCGFIKRTPRGRVATKRAYEHMGRDGFQDEEPNLFNFQ